MWGVKTGMFSRSSHFPPRSDGGVEHGGAHQDDRVADQVEDRCRRTDVATSPRIHERGGHPGTQTHQCSCQKGDSARAVGCGEEREQGPRHGDDSEKEADDEGDAVGLNRLAHQEEGQRSIEDHDASENDESKREHGFSNPVGLPICQERTDNSCIQARVLL